MTDDDTLTPEERQAYIVRYGEYRRLPIVRYGPFRIDRERHRHFSFATGERETPWYYLVFEVDASSEFDLMGSWSEMFKMWGSSPQAWKAWPVPSRADVCHLVQTWLQTWHYSPVGGESALACYRRRVGPPADGSEATPGDWYIDPLFRRPGNHMIGMAEATPLVEAALRELEQAEA